MPWIRRNLRGKKIYVRATSDGELDVAGDGRVEVKYSSAASAKVYRAFARNVKATGEAGDERPIDLPESPAGDAPGAPSGAPSSGGSRATPGDGGSDASNGQKSRRVSARRRADSGKGGEHATGAIPAGAIVVYTDGACTGNPGPAGIGVVIIDGKERRELSEYLGMGTNNIAELTAILRALEALGDDCARPIFVHSDSSYSLGLLTKNWKAKANTELVERLRRETRRFPDLRFVKVKGHAGIPENERADELARRAVSRRR